MDAGRADGQGREPDLTRAARPTRRPACAPRGFRQFAPVSARRRPWEKSVSFQRAGRFAPFPAFPPVPAVAAPAIEFPQFPQALLHLPESDGRQAGARDRSPGRERWRRPWPPARECCALSALADFSNIFSDTQVNIKYNWSTFRLDGRTSLLGARHSSGASCSSGPQKHERRATGVARAQQMT